ncbi:MAG: hypothetical protein AVDCRST_MAG86-2617, partial [uncultured Truepera sp.]
EPSGPDQHQLRGPRRLFFGREPTLLGGAHPLGSRV